MLEKHLILMVESFLCAHLLSFKDLNFTIVMSFFTFLIVIILNPTFPWHLGQLLGSPSSPGIIVIPRYFQATDSTINVIIRSDGQDVDVNAALAVLAGQAMLVINSTFDVDFFSLKRE